MGSNAEKRKARAAAARHSYFSRDEKLRAARRRGRAFLSKVFFGFCLSGGFVSAVVYAGSSWVKLGFVNWSGSATLLVIFLLLPVLVLALSRLVFGLIVPIVFSSVWKASQLLSMSEHSVLVRLLRQDQVWFLTLDGRVTRWVEMQIFAGDIEQQHV